MTHYEKAVLAQRLRSSLREVNMLIGTALANGMTVEIGDRSGKQLTTIQPGTPGAALTVRVFETIQTAY